MDNMKKALYLLMFLVLISGVYAEKVSIFNFNYDNGKIILKEQFIKEGYYPDRNIQIEEGYLCKLVDKEENILYSFRFELPTKLYTDVIEGGEIFGNVIILSETDFSFIVPYFTASDKLICHNPNKYEIINEDVEKIILSPEDGSSWLWVYIILAFIVLLLIIYRLKKKNKIEINS